MKIVLPPKYACLILRVGEPMVNSSSVNGTKSPAKIIPPPAPGVNTTSVLAAVLIERPAFNVSLATGIGVPNVGMGVGNPKNVLDVTTTLLLPPVPI